jgi:hypothetical protein
MKRNETKTKTKTKQNKNKTRQDKTARNPAHIHPEQAYSKTVGMFRTRSHKTYK